MHLVIQAGNSKLLQDSMESAGLGDAVGASRGDVGAILLALASTVQNSSVWPTMLLKLGESFVKYFENTLTQQDKILVELPGQFRIEVTLENLDQSLSTLKKYKLLPTRHARSGD